MALKVFEFIIDEEDNQTGMKAISLVDKPAMESQFIAFNKQDKPKVWKFQDEKKYIVAGLALVPDKLVYRVDEETEEEYLGYFSAETIEKIMNKFMKESTDGTLQNVNLQHNETNKVQAHLIESFILRTPEMVDAVKAMGIEDAVLGAWFVSYKFDDKEAYDAAIGGGFTGFSIEIMLQKELKLHKNKNKNVMTKVKSFINKFKTLLAEMETNLEDVVVPETGKSLRFGDVGTPVLWVSVDDAGEEVTEPAAEGEYILEDGRTLVVDAQGNLAEVKEAGTPVAPLPEEDLAKYPWDKCIADRLKDGYSQSAADKICGKIKADNMEEVDLDAVIIGLIKAGDTDLEAEYLKCNPKKKKLESGEFVDMPEDMPMPEASGDTAQPEAIDVTAKTLGELVDVTKDGEYYIYVSVAGGKVVEATVEAEQALVKAAEFSAVKTENETLKAQLAKPVVKPAFLEFDKPIEKPVADKAKMNNYEYTVARLGLKVEK